MRMENINSTAQLQAQAIGQEVGKLLNKNTITVDGNIIPEHIAALQTAKTIPNYLTDGDCLSPKLAIPGAIDIYSLN